MPKIIFNTRDELVVINTEMIAVVQASGNYSRVVFINKRETMLTMGITKFEEAIMSVKDKKYKFIRLGRSLVINHSYLQKIDIPKQQIILSDGTHDIKVNVSKKTLKAYKDATAESIRLRNSGKTRITDKTNSDEKANNTGDGGHATLQD